MSISEEEYQLLLTQAQEFRERLTREGVEVDIDPHAPVSEQLIRLQEAALREVSHSRQQFAAVQRHTFRSIRARESEIRFRTLVEMSPDAITQTDLEGRILTCNPQALRMHGYAAASELIGRPAFELIAPEDRERAAYNMRRTLENGTVHDLSYLLLRKDGTRFPGELNVALINDTDGHPSSFVAISRDITERHEADRALHESRERYRQLYQAVTDALFIHEVSPDGTMSPFLEVNEVAVSRLGYTREELLSMTPLEIDAPHSGVDLRPIIEATLNGDDVIFEQLHRTNDGRHIPVEVHAHTFNWQGRLADMSLVRDLTARKQAEEALKESEARFRALFANNRSGVFLTQPAGKIIAANPAGCAMLGRSEAEIIQLHPDEVLVNDTARQHALSERARTGAFFGELTCIRKDGSRFPVDVNSFLFDVPGCPTQAFVILRDITGRKAGREALVRERAFLDTALEILPLPLFFLDRDRRMIKANAALRDGLAQVGIADVTTIQLLDSLTHAPIPLDRRPTTRALHGEVVTGEECVLSVPGRAQHMPCLEYAAPIYLDGEIAAIVVLIQDISQLKEDDNTKDEFLATLSHELQTPLTSMLGWSDLALQSDDPAFLKAAMEVVHRNACRQKALIADMLDISHLIHGRFAISLQRTDLQAQVRQAVEETRTRAAERQLSVSLSLTETPLPVVADPARLQQCLGHLLDNSLKFTPAGGVITVACRADEAGACVTIADSGRGIVPEKLPHIFEPFHQVDRNEQMGGLGLGLAITRGIIALHNGTICAESPGEGQGCTLTISLPLATDTAASA